MDARAVELERHRLPTESSVHAYSPDGNVVNISRSGIKVKWKREKKVGVGAFGAVWLEKGEVGELRAVKCLLKRDFKNEPLEEVHALAKLRDHPDHFVHFLGWFEDKDSIFVAMGYTECGDLGTYIKNSWPKARREVREIAKQLLVGLAVLQRENICHRDLKPQNVLIASFSPIWVKIADFGVSKYEKDTELRTQCGTPAYCAPEQRGILPIPRKSYTNAADLWALGAIIHEILTSEIPFLLRLDNSGTPITGLGTEIGQEVDAGLLWKYCQGDSEFPSARLDKSVTGNEGIDLVKRLLIANPERRVSALDAQRSPWLLEENDSETLRIQFSCLGVQVDLDTVDHLVAQREVDQPYITQILSAYDVEAICYAGASNGYLLLVKSLLRLISDIDFRIPESGITSLQAAVGRGHVEVVKLLLDSGANGNAPPAASRTSLQEEEGEAPVDLVKLPLDSGANANAPPAASRTSLQEEEGEAPVDLVKLPLDSGANANAPSTDDSGTALEVMEARKQVQDSEHPAETYNWQEQRKEAEELDIQVVETREPILGIDHPNTFPDLAGLVETYRGQKQWKEAEDLNIQVVEGRKRILGIEHPDTLTAMLNLSVIYWMQKRCMEAEELAIHVVEAMKRNQGTEHQDTLSAMYHLAMVYISRKRLKESEELGIHVVEARKRILGIEHPETLAAMHNLAWNYMCQERWKEAEEIGIRVVEARKKMLGIEHPLTLLALNNLAGGYWMQKLWEKAEELYMQAVDATKQMHGIEHLDTLSAMHRLVEAYMSRKRWQEAEELLQPVVEVRERIQGIEHPDTLLAMHNLAVIYGGQGRWKAAEDLCIREVEAMKRINGIEHPGTLLAMFNLTNAYRARNRCKEAEELGIHVVEARKRILGIEHPETLLAMLNLADAYRARNRWKEAEELGIHVVEARKSILGMEHPDTLSARQNLAVTYGMQEKWKELEELGIHEVGVGKRILGNQHRDTSNAIDNPNHIRSGRGNINEIEVDSDRGGNSPEINDWRIKNKGFKGGLMKMWGIENRGSGASRSLLGRFRSGGSNTRG